MFTRKGICPPEYVGEDPICTEFALAHLAVHGVVFNTTVETIDRPVRVKLL